MTDVKKLSWMALFVAISAVGALIKIPAVIGTVALDSMPALIAAVILGPAAGAVTAAIGHLLSSLLVGMPLGPLHFLIMLEMAVLVWMFGKLYLKGQKFSADGLFFIGNAFVAPIPFIVLISMSFYMAMLPALAIGAALNIVVARILLPKLEPLLKKMIFKENPGERQ